MANDEQIVARLRASLSSMERAMIRQSWSRLNHTAICTQVFDRLCYGKKLGVEELITAAASGKNQQPNEIITCHGQYLAAFLHKLVAALCSTDGIGRTGEAQQPAFELGIRDTVVNHVLNNYSTGRPMWEEMGRVFADCMANHQANRNQRLPQKAWTTFSAILTDEWLKAWQIGQSMKRRVNEQHVSQAAVTVSLLNRWRRHASAHQAVGSRTSTGSTTSAGSSGGGGGGIRPRRNSGRNNQSTTQPDDNGQPRDVPPPSSRRAPKLGQIKHSRASESLCDSMATSHWLHPNDTLPLPHNGHSAGNLSPRPASPLHRDSTSTMTTSANKSPIPSPSSPSPTLGLGGAGGGPRPLSYRGGGSVHRSSMVRLPDTPGGDPAVTAAIVTATDRPVQLPTAPMGWAPAADGSNSGTGTGGTYVGHHQSRAKELHNVIMPGGRSPSGHSQHQPQPQPPQQQQRRAPKLAYNSDSYRSVSFCQYEPPEVVFKVNEQPYVENLDYKIKIMHNP